MKISLANTVDWLGICWPVVVEAWMGRLDRGVCNERLRAWAPRMLERAKVTFTVVGSELVDRKRPMLLMSNHASLYDIPVLYAAYGGNLRMVAKSELFKIPVVGRAMTESGMVELNRRDRKQAMQSLELGKELIRSGTSLWIAPEGTRSKTGELGPFKKGGFHLAMAEHLPIVPISLRGTGGILPPKALATHTGANVCVTFHAPIETEPYANDPNPKAAMERLMTVVREAIARDL